MERVTLNNGEQVNAGLTVLDQKGKPCVTLPAGATAEYVSNAEGVAQFEKGEGGILGKVTTLSDEIGVAVIHGKVTFADGASFEDDLEVTVVNSAPGSAKFTVGTPETDTPIL